MADTPRTVAIIGCGLVGKSFSVSFSSGGYNVRVYDASQEQLNVGMAAIKTLLEELQENGCLRGTLTAQECFRLITPCSSLQECVEPAFYVQECVPEKIELKLSVNAEIDKYVCDTAIIAGSTGNIFPSRLSENMTHRYRYLVAHPLNPPHLVPLVEIVPAPWTDQSAVAGARSFLDSVGQVPIVLKKESTGFVICRVQHTITAECFKLVRDGVIDVEDLEHLMPDGLGLRYAFLGALETSHLNANGMKTFCQHYGDQILDLQEASGPPIKLEGPLLDEVLAGLEKRVPLDKIEERREWRNECLAALIRLKKNTGK